MPSSVASPGNRALRTLPDAISLFRLLCSPVVAWLLFQSRFKAALCFVLLAGISDWLDGFAARRLDAAGGLGVVLDPLADKALLVTLFIVLAVLRIIPAWAFWLAFVRDLVIVGGAVAVRVFRGVKKFPPLMIGKVSTFFQIVLILLALCHAAYPFSIFRWLEEIALALTALFTFWSGVSYVRVGIAMARRRVPTPY